MRQVSPAQSGLPTSVDRYLLPDERSVIAVRMHPAALAGPLVLACGGLVAVRKLSVRSPRPPLCQTRLRHRSEANPLLSRARQEPPRRDYDDDRHGVGRCGA